MFGLQDKVIVSVRQNQAHRVAHKFFVAGKVECVEHVGDQQSYGGTAGCIAVQIAVVGGACADVISPSDVTSP